MTPSPPLRGRGGGGGSGVLSDGARRRPGEAPRAATQAPSPGGRADSHAEVPVAELDGLLGGQDRLLLVPVVHEDEVVPEALVLAELDRVLRAGSKWRVW